MKRVLFFGFFLTIISVFVFIYSNRGAIPSVKTPTRDIASEITRASVNNTDLPLSIPDGYQLDVYAEGFAKPRDLHIDSEGTLLLSDMSEGTIYSLPSKKVVAAGLNKPHGIATHCDTLACYLYIAEEHQVSRFKYIPDKAIASDPIKLFDISIGGRHTSRSILISDEMLFASVGSSCDTCLEADFDRATVLSSNLDGSDLNVYSSGLRNAVFLTEHPSTKEIWVTEMGRDFLGDDLPPDEVNILEKGGFFGWPYCYGKNILDTKFDTSIKANNTCQSAVASEYDLQAHSAPLGLDFLDTNSLLVAYHGSWNRTIPTGYKVVEINTKTGEINDFISGWLDENGEVLGRPVDVLVDDIGGIYVSDDKAGLVYRLEKL